MLGKQVELYSLQQFKEQYEQEVISEWLEAYIDFESIEDFLHFLKNNYHHYSHQLFRNHQTCIEIMPVQVEVRKEIEKAIEYIDIVVADGEEKANKFIQWKLSQILYYWEELIQLTIGHELEEELSHEIYGKKRYIKQLIKIVYANALYLKEFIDLNIKIKKCCGEVKHDYAYPLLLHSYESPINRSEEMLKQQTENQQQRKLQSSFKQKDQNEIEISKEEKEEKEEEKEEKRVKYLKIIEQRAKQLFYSAIYFSEYQESEITEYTRITSKKISSKNYFLLGLYIGLGLVIFISLILLLILDLFKFQQADTDIDSMTYIFPMFRGVGLLILYLWGMAWNVYVFIRFKINFTAILEYGSHYSSHFQIMKRAGFFTLVFCLMLFLYLVGLQVNKNKSVYLPIQYTPFVVWMLYFAYIFFPIKEMFNSKGRIYFYSLLKNIFLTPFVKMGFVLSFATDQAVSFVTSIKDLAYTVCFYGSSFTVEDVSSCLKSTSIDGFIIVYVAAIVPLLLRMIQCYNQARQSSGKFIGHLQMWNFLKYLSSVITSTLSFFNSLYPSMLVPFIISSVISTSYSYYWDLVVLPLFRKTIGDFSKKGSKYPFLRNHLCYKNPFVYYVAILVNLIFRCSWTLTISPSVVSLIPKSTFLPFLTGLIEIFRRCMWNFFRIEKEHVINCNSFTIIKQKPDQIIAKIKSERVSKPFRVNTGKSTVYYMKTSNKNFMVHLKSIDCKDLPKIEVENIKKSKQEFQQVYKSIISDQTSSKKKINRQILQKMKKNYFDI